MALGMSSFFHRSVSMPESTIQPPQVAGAPMSGGYILVVIVSSRTNNIERRPDRPDTINFRVSDLSFSQISLVNLEQSGGGSGLSGMRGNFPATSTNRCPGLHITTR
jgi:hypothetical protein